MKISLNKVKQFTDIKISEKDLVSKIGQQLGAVEDIIEFGKKYEGALIAKIVSCEKHSNADKLSVCLIDDKGASKTAKRNKDGYIKVVCGAPNVRAGLTVVWLPPKVTVPSTFGKEAFVLEAKELRGVISQGMIASPKELAISDDHSGILELENKLKAGSTFTDAFGLKDDIVLDLENKMFTHRPDCFGWLGLAREIAGIQHKPFKSPDWYDQNISLAKAAEDALSLKVINELPELVPRFCAVAISGVSVKKSPVWLQIELARVGLNPINNVVDLTNYLMLLTGQPLHAYDYDKLSKADGVAKQATLKVRKPAKAEKIALLNGKTIEPRNEAIMIASDKKLVGVGGVMGGSETEVDEKTTNIVLEAANFDLYSVRRTSMHHGLFTDAVTRFSKGQSPHQTLPVIIHAMQQITQLCGGHQASKIIDDKNIKPQRSVRIKVDFINKLLGSDLDEQKIVSLLKNVEFGVTLNDGSIEVKPPFWRTDIHIAEDIVEEVGRLYGYANLPQSLPSRSIAPVASDELLKFKSLLRSRLESFGANELLNYSFVHGNLLDRAEQNSKMAYKLSNALSPDLQYYRMSLTPSLLDHVHQNIKSGHNEFALYELGKSHNKAHKKDDGGVPKEFEMLALVFSGKHVKAGQAYFSARRYLDSLADSLHIELEYKPIQKDSDFPVVKPYEIKRSALVFEAGTARALGIIGEYKTAVSSKFKLPEGTAGFEVGLNELLASASRASGYQPLSKYPSINQDICLQVNNDINFAKLSTALHKSLTRELQDEQKVEITPIDIFTSKELKNEKRITFHIKLTSYVQTLTENNLTQLLDKAATELKNSLNAERI